MKFKLFLIVVLLSLVFATKVNYQESIKIERSISSEELAKRILKNDAPNRRDQYIECGTTEL